MLVCLSDWGIHTPPYIHMPPVYLYAPYVNTPPVHLYGSIYHMFSLCHGELRASIHPICQGVFWGHQYICQEFLSLLVHPFAPQFITVIPVAPHHCGLLRYWTGCLWMYATFHAVAFPFLCSVFIMSQASTTTARTTTPPMTVLCSSTSSLLSTVTMAPSLMGLPVTSGQHDLVLPPPLTLRSLDVLLASPLYCSSNLSHRCLFRLMPIMHGSSTGRFLFQSCAFHSILFVCCLFLLYVFCFQMPCWMLY